MNIEIQTIGQGTVNTNTGNLQTIDSEDILTLDNNTIETIFTSVTATGVPAENWGVSGWYFNGSYLGNTTSITFNPSEDGTLLCIFTNVYALIFDRTQADVDKVKELAGKFKNGTITDMEKVEWNTGLKGSINTSDLTRVLYYINYLAENINIPITEQTTVPEIPRVSWYGVLLSNLNKLKRNYSVHEDTPDIPTQPLNTYQKWNAIEEILFDLNEIYESQTWYYTGNDDLYANGNILI